MEHGPISTPNANEPHSHIPGLFGVGVGSRRRYLAAGLRIRTMALRHWLAGRRNGVSATELIKFLLLAPAASRGKRYVTRMTQDAEFNVVSLRGFDHPIYCPRDYDLLSLYLSFLLQSPDNWHCYEFKEVRVGPDDVVIDCGAAEGVFSMSVEGRCKAVYAVEPMPRYVSALQRTFNETNTVEILPFALSDRFGEATIVESGPLSSIDIPKKGDSVTVKSATVDGLFFEKGIEVNFMKADLEGHEMHMLAGAENTIREYLPKIAITSYHKASDANDICQFIRNIDSRYRIRTRGISNFGTPLMVYAWVE